MKRSGHTTAVDARALIVLCSHSVHDPLVSTLILDYVVRLQRSGPERDVLLITEEPSRERDTSMAQKLGASRIEWKPVPYDHREPFQWWHKFRNGMTMLRSCRRFRRSHPDCAVLGFLGIAGAYALIMKILLGIAKGVTFCFEPHSSYMREMGVWSRWAPKYLFTHWMEVLQIRYMDVLVVPTKTGLAQAIDLGRKKPTPMLGITIDVDACRFDAASRSTLRKAYGYDEETIFIYVGKFGGIYHSVDQYMAFMVGVGSLLPEVRFMVVTHPEWKQQLEEHAQRVLLDGRLLVLPPVPPEELHLVLSAADIGVVAIPPTPSQAFRTPVKTAHYWAAGLPILIPKGVSDDWQLALEHGTGIVVDDLPSAATEGLASRVGGFQGMDPEALREKCMACAMRYRDTSLSVELLNDILR